MDSGILSLSSLHFDPRMMTRIDRERDRDGRDVIAELGHAAVDSEHAHVLSVARLMLRPVDFLGGFGHST
jgi:hypothetical protein